MFQRLARLVVQHPWLVVLTWIVATAGVVAFAPGLSEVTVRDQSNFLPADDESVQAQKLGAEAFGQSEDPTAVLVVHRSDQAALTTADQARVGALADRLRAAAIPRVTSVETGPTAVSPNRKIQLVTITLRGTTDDKEVVDGVHRVRDVTASTLTGTPLVGLATGDAPGSSDVNDAIDSAMTIVGLVTIGLIILLMLVMFRSPVAAFLPIATVGLVFFLAPGLITLMAKAAGFEVDQQLTILLTIVLFGVGTDYIVFLLFRYREHLREGTAPQEALITAVTRINEVIASAAAAIIIAFSALVLASYGAFRSFGPGLAVGVAVMASATMTLIPAVVSLIGPRVFWPSTSWQHRKPSTLSDRVGALVARRPARVALVSGGLLVLLATATFSLRLSYDMTSSIPSDSDTSRGLTVLRTGFPVGALSPTGVLVRSNGPQRLDAAALERYAGTLQHLPGVGGVLAAGENGTLAAISRDGRTARINLLLTDDATSRKALDAVEKHIRPTAHAQAPAGTTARVGGSTSKTVDVRSANSRDLIVVFLAAGVLIAVVLALLLRSLVAPLYLMVAVLVNYIATLGTAVLAYQQAAGKDGVLSMIPILLYLFVVAIGTDYNILVIARLRELSRAGHSPRDAAHQALRHTAPSIGAAGIILAGTFTTLLFSGLEFLSEMGFAVSVGILLSAFVMALLLVPSLTALVGHRAWWPGHGDAAPGPDAGPAASGDPDLTPVPAGGPVEG